MTEELAYLRAECNVKRDKYKSFVRGISHPEALESERNVSEGLGLKK